jgi:hypothetical protein
VHGQSCVLDCYRHLHIPTGPALPFANRHHVGTYLACLPCFVSCILVRQENGRSRKLKSVEISSCVSGVESYAVGSWMSNVRCTTDCVAGVRYAVCSLMSNVRYTTDCVAGVRYAVGSWMSDVRYATNSCVASMR